MNLTNLLADMYSRCRYTSTPPTAVTTRMTRFINIVQRELLTSPGISKLRDDVIPVTAFANQAISGLPPAVVRVRKIVDRTNNHVLAEVPLGLLRDLDPAQAFVTGYPLRFAVLGYRQVQLQPTTSGSGLWAAASATASGTVTVNYETETVGGYHYSDSKAIATMGVTRVALGGLQTRTDHIEVDKFYLGAAISQTVGAYVSLYDAAVAGNELARIAPGDIYARYLSLAWHPIQTADTTLYCDYTRAIYDLVNGTDEPLVPDDFASVIINGALALEYQVIDDNRAGQAKLDYAMGRSALKSFVLNDGARLASLRATPLEWSSLGAQYPAGS